MNDYILRTSAGNGNIRGFFANMKGTVEEARRIHNTTPVVSAALGRTLIATAMMGLMLKNEKDLVTVSFKCDGPVGGLLATGDNHGRVKGYSFYNDVDIPLKSNGKLDVAGAVGKGELSVIKDMGLKEPYVGRTQIVSGEIAEDLTNYFAASEQVPTAIALGVLVDTDYTIKEAGGFIIQLLPGAGEEIISTLEENISKITSITSLIDEGKCPEDIMNMVLGDFDPIVLEKKEVSYHCGCSKERIEDLLITIGKEDLNQILEEDGKAEINCHFCNKNYLFDKNELAEIIKRI